MKAHTWVIRFVDGAHLGGDDCWFCDECGCCGGGAEDWDGGRREPTAFIAGLGYPNGELPDDCDESALLVAAYKGPQ